jgi:hypothetical protein
LLENLIFLGDGDYLARTVNPHKIPSSTHHATLFTVYLSIGGKPKARCFGGLKRVK